MNPPELLAQFRYLLVTPGGIGDAILFSPVIAGITGAGGSHRIVLVVSQKIVADVFGVGGQIEKCLLIRTNSPFRVKVAEMLRLARIARKERHTCCIVAAGCHPGWRMVIRYLGGVRNIIQAGCGDTTSLTDVDRNAKTVMALMQLEKSPGVLFPIHASQRLEAQSVAASHGLRLDSERYCVIYISRASKPGRLPPAGFLRLIQRLKALDTDMVFVLIGDGYEGREWESVDTQKEVINLGGALSVAACGEVFRKAAVAICNDGGLMHVAGAVGCPLIAVLGGTKLSYLPAGRQVRMVVSTRSDELPKFETRYPHIRWRSGLDVGDVVDVINSETARGYP